MKKITVQAEIKLPTVPNFFILTDGQSIPVSAVPESDLRYIGDLWTTALIDNAKRQKASMKS